MNERERFVRGTLIGASCIIAAALVAFGWLRLWDWALGFAVGAVVSLVSFQLIVASVVRLMGPTPSRPTARRFWWVRSLLRLLGAAALLLLAVRYLPVNLIGMAVGLLAVQLGMGGYLIVRYSSLETESVGGEDRKP
ncbi:MAG: ATP synthase subunit I [Candidatus Methylomirabilaceae bacterium]